MFEDILRDRLFQRLESLLGSAQGALYEPQDTERARAAIAEAYNLAILAREKSPRLLPLLLDGLDR